MHANMYTRTHTGTDALPRQSGDVDTAAKRDSFKWTFSLPSLLLTCLSPTFTPYDFFSGASLLIPSFLLLLIRLPLPFKANPEQQRHDCICWINVKCCSLATPPLNDTGWIMLFYLDWKFTYNFIMLNKFHNLRAHKILSELHCAHSNSSCLL